MLWLCPECDTKTEYLSENKDIEVSGILVCPSCKTLYDYDSSGTKTTKSQFDKKTYIQHLRGKIEAVRNQVAYTSSKEATYTLPCPHCKHPWEMEGIPSKSVHYCAKCYKYFGVDDVTLTINLNENERNFKNDYQVSAIEPIGLENYDLDKLAEFWTNHNYSKDKDKDKDSDSTV